MSRLSIALLAIVCLLGGGLAVSLTQKPQPVDTAAIRAVVDDALSQRAADQSPAPTAAALDAETLDPMIENYLLGHPEIMQRVADALQSQQAQQKIAASKVLVAENHDAIFNDPDQVVLGNPEGDVTLVEMFDYNCGYCRGALPDLATLLQEDKNLRVVLKEFPILSQESMDAARVAILVNEEKPADYWSFHEALFTSRGKVTGDTALDAAQKLGLSRVDLALRSGDPEVSTIIQKSYELAQKLNVTGTPTYIIGDEIIQGAIGLDGLRERIANMRECGETVCEG
jgi:protein-disulfide isomerase